MPRWDACTLEPNLWLRWIECHPALAGYLQTIGTIAAVSAAIAIPLLIRNADKAAARDNLRNRSKTFAVSLLGSFAAPALDFPRMKAALNVLKSHDANWPGTPDALRRVQITLPTALLDAQKILPEYDQEIVGPLSTAITAAVSYNTTVDGYVDATSVRPDRYAASRDVILSSLDDWIDKLEKIFDSSIGLTQPRQ